MVHVSSGEAASRQALIDDPQVVEARREIAVFSCCLEEPALGFVQREPPSLRALNRLAVRGQAVGKGTHSAPGARLRKRQVAEDSVGNLLHQGEVAAAV